jgi:hypothetical protein
MQRLYDRDFKCHQAVGRVAGEMLRSLADSLIIPFNVTEYVTGLDVIKERLDKDYGQTLQQNIVNYCQYITQKNFFQWIAFLVVKNKTRHAVANARYCNA